MEKAVAISLWKGSLQREFIMEKASCKGIYLWKMVSVKGLKGKTISKGICFGTGVVSLFCSGEFS